MKKTNKCLPEINLIGLKVRTRKSNELNPETAKIGQAVENYFQNTIAQDFSNRTKPGTTYCIYTEYESDENGEYTYFIGEEVDCFDTIDPRFSVLTIPSSDYVKFECGPGEMPTVCIQAWEKIWQMPESHLKKNRTYRADFEVYDERAIDATNTTLDFI